MSYFPVSGYVDPDDLKLPCGCVNRISGNRLACYVSTCPEGTRLWREYDAAWQRNNPAAWEWPLDPRPQIRAADLAIDVHYATGLRKLGWVLKRSGECLPVGDGNERAWGAIRIPEDDNGRVPRSFVTLNEPTEDDQPQITVQSG